MELYFAEILGHFDICFSQNQETKKYHYYDQETKIMTEIEYQTTTKDMTVSESATIQQKHKFSKKLNDCSGKV